VKTGTRILAVLALVAMTSALAAQQPPAFKRTVVQQNDLSIPGREVIQAVVEFQAGGSPGRHTHFGEEIAYVIDGTLVVEQDGKPPMTVDAGHGFTIPAGTVHTATAKTAAKILATYVVEKGKPLATPATK
jgi:quercetin dioxygenase-like cupin family protein